MNLKNGDRIVVKGQILVITFVKLGGIIVKRPGRRKSWFIPTYDIPKLTFKDQCLISLEKS